jgi:hypothetical protein
MLYDEDGIKICTDTKTVTIDPKGMQPSLQRDLYIYNKIEDALCSYELMHCENFARMEVVPSHLVITNGWTLNIKGKHFITL